ncbi:MAG: cytochrome-c peroxidase [Chitinophagaceae bacterium]
MKQLILVLFGVGIYFTACRVDPSFSDGHNHTHYNLNVPAGLPPVPVPSYNPMTVEGVTLGRKLFYDNILSANNTMNCGSCHQLRNYFVDSNLAHSTGIDGITGNRNSMPLFNIAWAKNFFWDGGAADLETQVIGPITNPIEMHETMENVVSKLQNHPEYPSLFKKAFGTDQVSSKYIMYAIAQFERTLISGDSKFDQWMAGKTSLTAEEERGRLIYLDENKGDCAHCHGYGSTFTDFEYRNTGLDSIPVDKGRALITLVSTDEGKFKTPSLRNIAHTGPYMHDGRFKTLRECIDHYNTGFKYTKNLAAELLPKTKGRMNEQDINDLMAFLRTLTDYNFVNQTQFDKP